AFLQVDQALTDFFWCAGVTVTRLTFTMNCPNLRLLLGTTRHHRASWSCLRLSLLAVFVFLAPLQSRPSTIPLGGDWRFALDRDDAGVKGEWFRRDLPGHIRLPGVLQSQNFGDLISTNTPWVLSLYDRYWYLREDYKPYTNTGNVKVPFLSQPPRHY